MLYSVATFVLGLAGGILVALGIVAVTMAGAMR
jgi:hypothetical protein